jgi:hypothetical protein
MAKIIDFISNPFIVAALVILATVFYQHWSNFNKRKIESELFFFHLKNYVKNSSEILSKIEHIKKFDDIPPLEDLNIYNPNIFNDYHPREIIGYCVHYRLKSKRVQLSKLFYDLEASIKMYSLSLDVLSKSYDSIGDLEDEDDNPFPTEKTIYVHGYNKLIKEFQENLMSLNYTIEAIEKIPLDSKWRFPFA